MIKSMTGFGRAEVVTDERKITIELKSVNHRYLDLSIKMPKKLSFLEGAIRNLMKTYIQRGKVDVYITCEDYTMNNGALKYNKELAGEYLTYLRQIQQDFGLDFDIKVSTLSRYPEVFVMEEQSVDEEALWNLSGTCLFGKHVRNSYRPVYRKAEIWRKIWQRSWMVWKRKF